MAYPLYFLNRLGLLGILLCSWMVTQAQTATEAWVRRYNSRQAGSLDYAFKLVTDTAGDVIVTGYTIDGITWRDLLVIKYSGAGVPLWTNRYDNVNNFVDQANAVAVDSSGNIFVIGRAADYVTIAYSTAGVALWTNHYNGPGNHDDFASAVAVDGNGNVFVTGSSVGIETGYDYATVAYSGAGVPLWTNRYNLPEEYSDDRAAALAVDNSGNVFVTGNHATVGYSGAGVALWTNHNSGAATAVVADKGGNIFVTGYVYTSSPNRDYETVAYSGSGVPLWTNRYNGPDGWDDAPSAVAVDSSGNVFVTGYSTDIRVPGTRADYLTVAYSGAGMPLWTNRYNGPRDKDDQASSIAVDHSGNVFVTGSSHIGFGSNNTEYATVAYSSAGVPLWTNRFNKAGDLSLSANSVAVDSNGNVFVTGASIASGGDHDAVVIAYSGTGLELWTNRYNGPANNDDQATAMAVGRGGDVIVTGYSVNLAGVNSGSLSSADFVTIAYSEAGVALWTNRYNGLGNGPDQARAVAVDGSDNIFVSGSSYRGGSFDYGNDYATVAYSGAGVPLWTNRYDGAGGGDDRAIGVAVDKSGRVFVTGSSIGSGFAADYDYATIAYSDMGIALWTNRYNGLANGSAYACALAVDGNGNVFVTGSATGSGTSFDYATVAYSGAGVALWTNRYNGPGNLEDYATAVAVDGRGNVVVTGSSKGSGGSPDFATVAYSGAGVPLWTNRYNSAYSYALAVDGNGNVFVTGEASNGYATIAYSEAGVALWTNHYIGGYATAVAVDGSGNVFVTGSSANDYATIGYSGTGVPLWTNRYNGPAKGRNVPAIGGLAVGRDGAVYVTGSSNGDYSGFGAVSDYATIKYVWRPYLSIQPLTAGSSTVNLSLSGPQSSSWSVQRALNITGPWTNLGVSLIGTDGLGTFSDASLPAQGAFYRVTQP